MKVASSLPSLLTAAAAVAILAAAPTLSADYEGNSTYPVCPNESNQSRKLPTQRSTKSDTSNHDEVDRLGYLQEKAPTDADLTAKKSTGEVRIFMAAVADMMHYGHANAFRLARSLGTHLTIGIHGDESILKYKGRPLVAEEDRVAMARSCKYVDQVISGVPYIMTDDYIQSLVDEYNIDYVIHGDDPCIVDGKDIYSASKEKGLFRTIPRTEGVSTTNLLNRLLSNLAKNETASTVNKLDKIKHRLSTGEDQSLVRKRMMRIFQDGAKEPSPGMKVVYVDGAFDMIHVGHIATLKAAKERGDYLIVGVHSDDSVSALRGDSTKLMDEDERALGVLACRYVDKVIPNAPHQVSQEWVEKHNISLVVRGTRSDRFVGDNPTRIKERYQYPKDAGILEIVDTPCQFQLQQVIKRIRDDQEAFQAQVERKMKAETDFFSEKLTRVRA